jgi:hypothetical protein
MGTDDIRKTSKELLGNKYRAEIGAAIHAWGTNPMTALAMSDHTGIRYGRVQEELVRLKEAGILQLVDQLAGATVEYKATSSVYWKLCADLLAELTAAS